MAHPHALWQTTAPEDLDMRRDVVTVFGGAGFLGRHVVRRLCREGATVRVAGRDPERALFLKPLGDVGQVVPWRADATDAASVERALVGATAAINLVGILFERGQRTFARVHVAGAENIARAAATAGIRRLVHVSALGADAGSESEYARTKADGEARVRAAFPRAAILRPSVVFGPEDDFFNRFAALARFSPALPVIGAPTFPRLRRGTGALPFALDFFGAGGPRMQPVYVGDVADAVMACLNRSETEGKTYELAGPRAYSFKDLMTLTLAAAGRRRLLVPLPFWLAEIEAMILQWMPMPLLTPDQVRLLMVDNVASGKLPDLKALGIEPTPAEAVVPGYLARYRPPTRRAGTAL
jgi:NADH dehydrogenase